MRDLDSIIKAYDVRGIYPDQLDEELAHDVGAAFVRVLGVATAQGGPGAVCIGHDMRPSGPDLVASFADGVREQGCDVILIGLCSTDGLYFASGSLGLPGAMFTASHNPAEYNGIKLCRAGAAPVGQDTGLADIKQMIRSGVPESDETMGEARSRDTLADYAGYLRELVDLTDIRPLTVVVDAGNGMAGYTVPAVLGEDAGLLALPLSIDRMYFELDGTFPNHEANPIEPANLIDIQARVRSTGADIGLAFDGDADRCFVVDEGGRIVSPSTLTALIAARELQRSPGSTVIHNLITSKAVPEVVSECGGSAVKTRVGHSFIKATMAKQTPSSAVSTRAISISVTSGELTRECSRRCTHCRTRVHTGRYDHLFAVDRVRTLCGLGGDQYPGRGSVGDDGSDRDHLRRPRRRHHRSHGRPDRRWWPVVVQRPAEQHGAVVAPECRGTRDGNDGNIAG